MSITYCNFESWCPNFYWAWIKQIFHKSFYVVFLLVKDWVIPKIGYIRVRVPRLLNQLCFIFVYIWWSGKKMKKKTLFNLALKPFFHGYHLFLNHVNASIFEQHNEHFPVIKRVQLLKKWLFFKNSVCKVCKIFFQLIIVLILCKLHLWLEKNRKHISYKTIHGTYRRRTQYVKNWKNSEKNEVFCSFLRYLLKIWVTSFMDGPLAIFDFILFLNF